MEPAVAFLDPLQDVSDIRQGFDAFIEASRRLETSYAELQNRAAAVDLQLAESNRELEQTLVEREMVFSSLPVGLLSLSGTGELRWCNREGERLQAQVGEAGFDLIELEPGAWEAGGLSLELRRVTMPDGGILLMAENKSQVRYLEREVDRLDRMAGLSELALGIAHEIKNPLNGVMGFAALLRRSKDPAKQEQYAAKISTGLEQVDSIVKALLAFARPTDNPAQPSMVSQLLADAAAAAGVPRDWLQVSFAPGFDQALQVDASVLIRVLGNLLRNSAEAKGERVAIRVDCRVLDRRLELLVRDDGPGVPIEHAERIFKPFFTTKDRGHGLGLALACRVLTFLDGSLELLNPGQPGATFRVTAPVLGEVHAAEVQGDA